MALQHKIKVPNSRVTAALTIGVLTLLAVVAALAQNAVASNVHRIEQIGRCAKPHIDWLYNEKTNTWQKVITCNGWKPGQAPE